MLTSSSAEEITSVKITHKEPSTYILLNLKATYKYKCSDKIPMNLGHVHFKSKFCPRFPTAGWMGTSPSLTALESEPWFARCRSVTRREVWRVTAWQRCCCCKHGRGWFLPQGARSEIHVRRIKIYWIILIMFLVDFVKWNKKGIGYNTVCMITLPIFLSFNSDPPSKT